MKAISRDFRISETHSFTEMSLHPFVQLGIPVILAGLASGLAWQERSGWLVVSTVCLYGVFLRDGISSGVFDRSCVLARGGGPPCRERSDAGRQARRRAVNTRR